MTPLPEDLTIIIEAGESFPSALIEGAGQVIEATRELGSWMAQEPLRDVLPALAARLQDEARLQLGESPARRGSR